MKPKRNGYSAQVPSDFALRLLEFRLERLWTLEQMAKAADLTASTIHAFEVGKRIPTRLTYAKLMRAFPALFEDVA